MPTADPTIIRSNSPSWNRHIEILTQKALALIRVQTIGDLSRIPPAILTAKFGKAGIMMQKFAAGIDPRPVEPAQEAKSIGHEEIFTEDLRDKKRIEKELLSLCLKVGKRARDRDLVGRTVTIKVKYRDFMQVTRSLTLPEPVADDKAIDTISARYGSGSIVPATLVEKREKEQRE